jgi:hypothetical protein
MARYIRNTLILAKIETTPGTDATPVGTTDAVLVSNVSITPLNATNIDRAFIRPYFGASEQLVGVADIKCSFEVELAGGGTAGATNPWASLIEACATVESLLTTPSRAEYTPVSTSLKTVTIYWYDDGVLHKLLGAMGNCKLSFKAGGRPMLTFDFIGTDGGISAATATGTFTQWKTPVPMTKANVVDITLGATYATGTLTGGTSYPSTGLDLDLGNSVQFIPTLSYEQVDITDRTVTGSMQLDLTAAQEVTFMGNVKANTEQSLAMTIGSAAGSTIIVYAPKVQLINPVKAELNGRRMLGYSLRVVPNSGNDELLICVK